MMLFYYVKLNVMGRICFVQFPQSPHSSLVVCGLVHLPEESVWGCKPHLELPVKCLDHSQSQVGWCMYVRLGLRPGTIYSAPLYKLTHLELIGKYHTCVAGLDILICLMFI